MRIVEQTNEFHEFRNNVFCRREDNQHKAKKSWNMINKCMSNNDKMLFEIEWNHFMMGELDIDDFTFYFTKHVMKYVTKYE